MLGLAPYLPHHRPRAAPRWWIARADAGGTITSLDEQESLPAVDGRAGIAAPCSLPPEFLEHLGRPPAAMTAERLCREARVFAASRTRGQRHPLRHPGESRSSLDRRQLILHHAALPLIEVATEVDVHAWLRSRELPHAGLSGNLPAAIDARASILDALSVVDPRVRDRALANVDALRAVVCIRAMRERS